MLLEMGAIALLAIVARRGIIGIRLRRNPCLPAAPAGVTRAIVWPRELRAGLRHSPCRRPGRSALVRISEADMKSIVAVVVVGIIGFVATAFNPAQEMEMWAPLIVSLVPLLVFMMWPVRDEAAATGSGHKKAA